MKLIPMTDFVLQQYEQFKKDGHPGRIITCGKYAMLLKKDLDMSMFIPCEGGQGNILNKPEKPLSPASDEDWEMWQFENFVYDKAKSECLFEGFKINLFEGKGNVSKTICWSNTLHVFWFDDITQTWNPSIGIKNIEGLVNYGLTLTPHAKTLIG